MAGSEAPEQEGTGDVLKRDSSRWDWYGSWIHQHGRRKTKSVSAYISIITAMINTVLFLAGMHTKSGRQY